MARLQVGPALRAESSVCRFDYINTQGLQSGWAACFGVVPDLLKMIVGIRGIDVPEHKNSKARTVICQ